MVRPMLTAEERARGQRLGAVLRQARGERSMVEVAALAGVPVETLRKIETGRIPTPAFFTVVALAEAVGVPLGALAATADLPARPRRPLRRPAAIPLRLTRAANPTKSHKDGQQLLRYRARDVPVSLPVVETGPWGETKGGS